MDETLVHATADRLAHPADFECPPYYVYKRPHIDELLSQTRPFYDFAVWSSSSQAYVDAVVRQVFAARFELKFVWASDRCVQRVDVQSNGYVYIKDLRKVQSQGYQLERILMIDDSPEKIARQPRNHIKIKPFLGQAYDIELLSLADELIRRLGV